MIKNAGCVSVPACTDTVRGGLGIVLAGLGVVRAGIGIVRGGRMSVVAGTGMGRLD